MDMTIWYDVLKKMYREEGRATEKTLTAAVARGWISEEEKKEIMEGGK